MVEPTLRSLVDSLAGIGEIPKGTPTSAAATLSGISMPQGSPPGGALYPALPHLFCFQVQTSGNWGSFASPGTGPSVLARIPLGIPQLWVDKPTHKYVTQCPKCLLTFCERPISTRDYALLAMFSSEEPGSRPRRMDLAAHSEFRWQGANRKTLFSPRMKPRGKAPVHTTWEIHDFYLPSNTKVYMACRWCKIVNCDLLGNRKWMKG